MAYLLDTNILLRYVLSTDPADERVQNAVRRLREAGEHLHFAPQNVAEAWNVATRPLDRNGFGLSPTEAGEMADRLERAFWLRPDSPAMYAHGRRLVREAGVSGVQVHDARLVAWMQAHAVMHLLTLNPSDFVRYAGITVVEPGEVEA